MKSKYTGKYTKAFLSKRKAKAESIETDLYNSLIEIGENEMVYIYSFKGNKLLFAKGYNKLLNIPDEEIDVLKLNSLFQEYYEKFIFEYHDRLLLFLYNNNKNIDSFSSYCIVKVKDYDTNIMLNIKVFKTDDNGNLVSVIGRNVSDKDLKTSDVIQYSFNGDFDSKIKNSINNDLDFNKCISLQNIQMIEALEEGKNRKEISDMLEIEESQVKRNLEKLLVRFSIKDENELITFAKENYLIPNQFNKYLNK